VSDAKPLSEKARRFAELYAGDGVAAARAAGYTGTPASLAVTASRLRSDPRVAAIVEARAAGTYRSDAAPKRKAPKRKPPPPPPDPEPDEDDLYDEPPPPPPPRRVRHVDVDAAQEEALAGGVDPIEVLELIAADTTIHASSRVQAAKALERHRRETDTAGADPLADLRAKVAEVLRAKRERERS
jgi:phage terminase small subunit